MKIDKVLEVLNEALACKDLALWVKDEEIKQLKAEIETLKKENTNEQSN